jgi:transcriptional regulator with XRE-family HTH domain
MDGTELKMMRIKRGIKAVVLAEQLGVSPARVTQIESRRDAEVSELWTIRFIQALNKIQNNERIDEENGKK